MRTTSIYEVVTPKSCLLIEAFSHDDAKAIVEKQGHNVLASAHTEYLNDIKIYDEKGYSETLQ